MALRELVDARDRYTTKNATLAAVLKEAATSDPKVTDFSQVKALGDEFAKLDTPAQLDRVRELNTEVMDLFDRMKRLDMSDLDAAHALRDGDAKARPNPMIHSQTSKAESSGLERKSIGDWFGGPDGEFTKRIKAGDGQGRSRFQVTDDEIWPSQVAEFGMKSVFPMESKTVFSTSAGWAAESLRLPGWVDSPTRQLGVLDSIPVGRTSQAAIVYMLESTFTPAAAERSEAAAYAEATFALTATTETVRSVGASIPTTDEQLADVQQAETYLRSRLGFGVRQRLDLQILVGNASAPNLRGAATVTGSQTQAKGADPTPDAIFKGLNLIRSVGFAEPGVIFMHPDDWQDIRLLRTSDGMYIWGNPSEAGPTRMFGVPVVVTTAQTENTAAIIDNSPAMCMLFERQGLTIEVGFVNDDFLDGRKTLRAGLRAAMVWFRATAICEVTGI
jgi:HK97 family phage major capsid protein